MSFTHLVRDNVRYLLFSQLYNKIPSAKGRRKALLIVETSICLMAKHGLDSVTLDQIANKSDISKSLIQYYFGNFLEIKMFAIRYVRLIYQKAVITAIEKQNNPYDMFKAYFETCLSWPKTFPRHSSFWLSFLHNCQKNDDMKKLNTEMVEVGLKRLESLLQIGQETKVFNFDNLEQSALSIHLLITGIIYSGATETEEITRVQKDLMFETCLHLLGCTTAHHSCQPSL